MVFLTRETQIVSLAICMGYFLVRRVIIQNPTHFDHSSAQIKAGVRDSIWSRYSSPFFLPEVSSTTNLCPKKYSTSLSCARSVFFWDSNPILCLKVHVSFIHAPQSACRAKLIIFTLKIKSFIFKPHTHIRSFLWDTLLQPAAIYMISAVTYMVSSRKWGHTYVVLSISSSLVSRDETIIGSIREPIFI